MPKFYVLAWLLWHAILFSLRNFNSKKKFRSRLLLFAIILIYMEWIKVQSAEPTPAPAPMTQILTILVLLCHRVNKKLSLKEIRLWWFLFCQFQMRGVFCIVCILFCLNKSNGHPDRSFVFCSRLKLFMLLERHRWYFSVSGLHS